MDDGTNLNNLSYKQLQTLALKYQVPGNIRKHLLIKVLKAAKQGNQSEIKRILEELHEDRREKQRQRAKIIRKKGKKKSNIPQNFNYIDLISTDTTTTTTTTTTPTTTFLETHDHKWIAGQHQINMITKIGVGGTVAKTCNHQKIKGQISCLSSSSSLSSSLPSSPSSPTGCGAHNYQDLDKFLSGGIQQEFLYGRHHRRHDHHHDNYRVIGNDELYSSSAATGTATIVDLRINQSKNIIHDQAIIFNHNNYLNMNNTGQPQQQQQDHSKLLKKMLQAPAGTNLKQLATSEDFYNIPQMYHDDPQNDIYHDDDSDTLTAESESIFDQPHQYYLHRQHHLDQDHDHAILNNTKIHSYNNLNSDDYYHDHHHQQEDHHGFFHVNYSNHAMMQNCEKWLATNASSSTEITNFNYDNNNYSSSEYVDAFGNCHYCGGHHRQHENFDLCGQNQYQFHDDIEHHDQQEEKVGDQEAALVNDAQMNFFEWTCAKYPSESLTPVQMNSIFQDQYHYDHRDQQQETIPTTTALVTNFQNQDVVTKLEYYHDEPPPPSSSSALPGLDEKHDFTIAEYHDYQDEKNLQNVIESSSAETMAPAIDQIYCDQFSIVNHDTLNTSSSYWPSWNLTTNDSNIHEELSSPSQLQPPIFQLENLVNLKKISKNEMDQEPKYNHEANQTACVYCYTRPIVIAQKISTRSPAVSTSYAQEINLTSVIRDSSLTTNCLIYDNSSST